MKASAAGVVFSLIAILSASLSPVAHAADSGTKTKQSQAKAKTKRKVVRAAPMHSGDDASLDSREKLVRKVVFTNGKRRVVYQRVAYHPSIPVVPAMPSAGDLAGLNGTHDPLSLASNVALVVDQTTSQILFEKNSSVALPIASITKLMTSLIVVEANQDLNEVLEVTADDVDHEKNSGSRLRVGSRLSREDMLHIALMSSENRAASALSRNYPGGLPAFVAAMNAKARSLGMMDTHYVEGTGLSSQNVSSARDLAKLVAAAYQQPLIRQFSTDSKYTVDVSGRLMQYSSSNRLVSNPTWEIGLQKTGFINEAGRCMVMQATIENRPVIMVFLDSKGKMSRIADAGRIRKWLESNNKLQMIQASAQQHQS